MHKPFWIGRTSLPFKQLTCSEIVVSAMKDLRQLTTILSIGKPSPEWFVAIDHHSHTSSPQYATRLRCALTDSQPTRSIPVARIAR